MNEKDIFTSRAQNLFAAIFSYHFNRKPIFSERQTPFGSYASVRFRNATASPLALLLSDGNICDPPKAVEILAKNRFNKAIDDLDLESVIHGVRQEKNTLFILCSSGDFERDDYDRLFRVFSRHLVIVLPLGKDDIIELEKFAAKGNINACLIILFRFANRITTDPWETKLIEKHGGWYAARNEWQEKATKARLDKLAKLDGPQLRTLIKKLLFLINFEKSGNEISKACETVKISRKTFYLWMENDPIFKRAFETQ